MPSERVRTTPDQWKRVGVETQESKYHRVQAQRDFVDDAWRFVAVRRGDGIHPCKVLGTFATAKEARELCELDEYEFHWPDLAECRKVERAALNLQPLEFYEANQRGIELRRATRKDRRAMKKLEKRKESWKS